MIESPYNKKPLLSRLLVKAKSAFTFPFGTGQTGFSSDPGAGVASGRTKGGHINVTVEDRLREVLRTRLYPTEVEQILKLALDGNLIWQQRLFERMLDTWPRLVKNLNEVLGAIERLPFSVNPALPDGSKVPTASAQEKADLVERAMRGMRPDITRHQRNFKNTVRDVCSSMFYGHSVNEIYWEKRGGEVLPQCTRALPARYYAYPHLVTEEDRLMLNPTGAVSNSMADLTDFPANQFLIGIRSVSSAHPAVGALFRCLAGWWLASTFGLEWFMQYAQLFGIPWRIAKYKTGDMQVYNTLVGLMEQVGAAGWAVVPEDASFELHDVGKNSTTIPQVVIMDNADKVCDLLLLGQTLTSDTGKTGSGSRALGQVHQDVRDELLSAYADYTCEILNDQFCPYLMALNYGNAADPETPHISGTIDQPQDEKAIAERDQILFQQMGLPVSIDYLYEHNKVPQPADDDELYTPPVSANPMQKDPEESLATPGIEAVRASNAGRRLRPNLEKLVDKVMEDVSGVSAEWLQPVRPIFQQLIALAKDGDVSDERFVAALRAAEKKLPSQFSHLKVEVLEKALSDAMAAGLINGITDRRLTSLASRSEAVFKPPQEVAEVVQEALRHHPNGTPIPWVTLVRAQRIARREPISIETIERLAKHFAGVEPGDKNTTSAVHALHGGEAGRSWVSQVLTEHVRNLKEPELAE